MLKNVFAAPIKLFWLAKNGGSLWQLIKLHQETITQLEARLASLEAERKQQQQWNDHLMQWQIKLDYKVEGLKEWRSK